MSKHIIELYEYERIPDPVRKCNDAMTTYLLTGDETFLEKKEHKPAWLQDYIRKKATRSNGYRSRANFRRLVVSNFDGDCNFITLTFKEDIRDVKQANKVFDLFMKRLRYKYGNKFKFIVVVEFQDLNRQGVVHFHMLVDLNLTWQSEDECKQLERIFAEEMWRQGFVDLKNVEHVDNLGAYMSKYMVKRMDDERLAGLKSYRCSKNLDRPLVFKGEDAAAIIELYNLNNKKEVSTNSYESEYLGNIIYKQYNLKRIDN